MNKECLPTCMPKFERKNKSYRCSSFEVSKMSPRAGERSGSKSIMVLLWCNYTLHWSLTICGNFTLLGSYETVGFAASMLVMAFMDATAFQGMLACVFGHFADFSTYLAVESFALLWGALDLRDVFRSKKVLVFGARCHE